MSTRKAFEKFMEGNIDNAYRFAYTFVKNKPDAEDILSESAVKALKAIKTLKDEKYLKSWFYKINHQHRNHAHKPRQESCQRRFFAVRRNFAQR